MQRSEQIGDLISALAKAQAEFAPAIKESEATIKGTSKKTGVSYEYKYNYADLAANISAIRPALNKHGIALLQFDEADLEHQTASVTTALHFGEQWISQTAEAPAVGIAGFDMDSISSCWTKLRRYTLQALCGVASEDDDARSLAGVDNQPIQKSKAEVRASAEKRAEALEEEYSKNAGVFEVNGDVLKCVVKGATKQQTKGEHPKPYLSVVFNGRVHGFNYATTFDTVLFDLIMGCVDQTVEFKLRPWKEGDKFLNIVEIISIGGISVDDPKATPTA